MRSTDFGDAEKDEVLEDFVLIWRPSSLRPDEGCDDPNFLPTTTGSWRPRRIKAVIERQEINLSGREGDEEVRSIAGSITIRKLDAAFTIRLDCQIADLDSACPFEVSEKYPVRFANPDSLPAGEVLTLERLAELSGSKDLRTVALSRLRKENPNHLVHFVYGNIGMKIVTNQGRPYFIVFTNPEMCYRWLTSIREVMRTQLELETFVAPTNTRMVVPAEVSARTLDLSAQVSAFLSDAGMSRSQKAAKITGAPPSSGFLLIVRYGRPSKWIVRLDSSIDAEHPEQTMNLPQLMHFMKVGKTILQLPVNALRRALPISLLDAESVDAKKLTVVVTNPFGRELLLEYRPDDDGQATQRMEVVTGSLENRLQWEDWFCRYGASKRVPAVAPTPSDVTEPTVSSLEGTNSASFQKYFSTVASSRSRSATPRESVRGMSDLITPEFSLPRSQAQSQRLSRAVTANLPDPGAPVQIVVSGDHLSGNIDLADCTNMESVVFRAGSETPTSCSSQSAEPEDPLAATVFSDRSPQDTQLEGEQSAADTETSSADAFNEKAIAKVTLVDDSVQEDQGTSKVGSTALPRGAFLVPPSERATRRESSPTALNSRGAHTTGGRSLSSDSEAKLGTEDQSGYFNITQKDSKETRQNVDKDPDFDMRKTRKASERSCESVLPVPSENIVFAQDVEESRSDHRISDACSGDGSQQVVGTSAPACKPMVLVSTVPGVIWRKNNDSVFESERNEAPIASHFPKAPLSSASPETKGQPSPPPQGTPQVMERNHADQTVVNLSTPIRQPPPSGVPDDLENFMTPVPPTASPVVVATLKAEAAAVATGANPEPSPDHSTVSPPTRRSPFFSDLRMNSEAFRYELSPCFLSPTSTAKKTEVELFRDSILSLRAPGDHDCRKPCLTLLAAPIPTSAASEICAICGNDKLIVSICSFTGKVHQLLSQCRLLRKAFPKVPDPPEVTQAKRILGI